AADARRRSPTPLHILTALAVGPATTRMQTAEHFRDTKVGDFDMALVRQEEILEFDIPMSDAMVMQISNPTEHLLEETELVFLLQILSFDQGIQFAILAVLHHMIPATGLRAKANRPDNVGMIQRFGDAVLRLDLSDVLCLALVGGSFAEFLDRVLITLGLSSSDHNLDRRCGALANFFPTANFG